MKPKVYCRCCGKVTWYTDGYPIHTGCIVRHWTKHNRYINASRCQEFKTRKEEVN